MTTTQALDFSPTTATPAAVVPISGAAEWVTAIAAGGLIVTEVTGGGVVVDPGQITHSSRRILTRPVYGGTTLRLRMNYSTGDTIDTTKPPLTIRVFGVTNSQTYTVLRNLNGDASVPIPIDPATDAHEYPAGGTDITITQPDNNAHSWDCDGYNKFLIGVEQRYYPTGGGGSAAYLQAKIV